MAGEIAEVAAVHKAVFGVRLGREVDGTAAVGADHPDICVLVLLRRKRAQGEDELVAERMRWRSKRPPHAVDLDGPVRQLEDGNPRAAPLVSPGR
jgi:hypothetical protein